MSLTQILIKFAKGCWPKPPQFRPLQIPIPNLITYSVSNISLKYCTSAQKPVATFEEVKAAHNTKTVVLVDVREPSEIKETGCIPGSINIPLGEVEITLKTVSEKDFINRYGREKPDINTKIIFYCKIGRRSGQAQTLALQLGFKHVKNYEGSWSEWEEKELRPIIEMSKPTLSTVTFSEVQKLTNCTKVLLIDVRESAELQESGSIPSSINIPLSNVENVLKDLSQEEFKDCFGRDKPGKEFPLIFYCKSGRRAEKAHETALKLGYNDVKNYPGSWTEWAERSKEQ